MPQFVSDRAVKKVYCGLVLSQSPASRDLSFDLGLSRSRGDVNSVTL